MRHLRYGLLALLTVAASVLGASTASAVQTAQPTIVVDRAVSWTPAIQDGAVRAIAQVGNTIVLGGTFSQVTPSGGGATVARHYILAFNATTGALSQTFQPQLDGNVNALVPSADGQSVYVGGEFNNANGVKAKSLTRVRISDGTTLTSFKTVAINGNVTDLKLSGNRLWVGGNFSKFASKTQAAIATVDATTGSYDPFFALTISGTHNGGRTSLQKFDVTPDGHKLLAIGNFTSVGGASHDQIVMLDLTGPSAALANWGTTFYSGQCAGVFDSYMRDLDISPDGSYAVVSTTGAYRGSTGPCDETARWEMGATGANLNPTWINYTGGDTTYAVAATGTAVYVGGHFRWQNNAFAGDRAGQGSVAREGIAALDPASGLPLDWNPGRARGVGVFDMLATPSGLWVGSDTDRIGGWTKHPKIAFFPLAGGAAVPPTTTQTLPGRVVLAGNVPGASADAAVSRSFDGTTASGTTNLPSSTISWSQARGAVMVGNTLYTGWSDGNLYGRTYNGTTFGTAVNVDGMDQIVPLANFHSEVPNITAMFFDHGQLYYSLAGQSSLYYRSFTPSTRVIGAVRYTAANLSSLSFANASAMLLSGGRLYVGDRTAATLRAVNFANGQVSGTPALVSGPAVDGQSWNARAIFIAPGAVTPPNSPPVAAITTSCVQLACTFDGTGSADTDGTVTGWSWNFGDGATSTLASPQHTYAAAGPRTVTLTVTDNRGGTGTTHQDITVSATTAQIGFVGAASANNNAKKVTVTAPSGIHSGDGLVLIATAAKNTLTMSAPAGWASVSTTTSNGLLTQVWQQVATSTSAGSQVAVSMSASAKVNLTLAAYSGTRASAPVASVTAATETTKRAVHTTPAATASVAGSWVVSYWADNTTDTTAWTAPSGQSVRGTAFGSGGGHVSSLMTDGNAATTLGSVGGLAATANSANVKAQMLTVVLVPAG